MKFIQLALLLMIAAFGFNSYAQEADDIYEGDMLISSSRTYSPNVFNNFQALVEFGRFYEVPDEVHVISGNAGEGWYSLILGERKFCYQGNVLDDSAEVAGDKYIIAGELINVWDECVSENFEDDVDDFIYLEEGDVVIGVIDSGAIKVEADLLQAEE